MRINQMNPAYRETAAHRVAKLAEVTEREERVLEARIAGHSLRQIARDLGVTHPTVMTDLRNAMAKTKMANAPKIEEARAIEAERLDAWQTRATELLASEDPAVVAKALTSLVALSNRRAAMLGLDAPAKSAVEVSNPAAEAEARARKRALAADPEASRLLQELAARQAALLPPPIQEADGEDADTD